LNKLETRFAFVFTNRTREEKTKFKGIYLAATFLDPRFRENLSTPDTKSAMTYLKENWQQWLKFNQAELTTANKKRKYQVAKKSKKFTPTQQLKNFSIDFNMDIEDDRLDPLKFWDKCAAKGYPDLKKIAINILSTPSSGAPVERMFSIAGIACNGRRNRLKAQNLERDVFMSEKYEIV